MGRCTVRRAGGRPESQWLRSDERRGQAYWRRSGRSKRIPFRLLDYPRSSLTPLSPFSLSNSLFLSLLICSSFCEVWKWCLGYSVWPIIVIISPKSDSPKERTTLFCFWFFFFNLNNIWFFIVCFVESMKKWESEKQLFCLAEEKSGKIKNIIYINWLLCLVT